MDSYNFHAPLSAHSRANAAIITLCLFLVYQGLVLVVGFIEFATLSSAADTGADVGKAMTAIAVLKLFLSVGHFFLFVATSIAVLMWVHRAHRVLVERRVPGLEFTSGWAVGWFFIPFANLFKPYLAVKEIYLRSDGKALEQDAAEPDKPAESAQQSGGPWLTGWWAGWLLSSALNTLAFIALRRATNIILYYGALKVVFLNEIVFAATTALLIVVISKIDNRQRRLASRLVQPPPVAAPTPEPVA